MGGLDNPLETMLYYLTLISLWVAIYTFLKRYRRPYLGLYDKVQTLFPINGNSFQRKPKLIATPYILQ